MFAFSHYIAAYYHWAYKFALIAFARPARSVVMFMCGAILVTVLPTQVLPDWFFYVFLSAVAIPIYASVRAFWGQVIRS